jgi:hypothetical protein
MTSIISQCVLCSYLEHDQKFQTYKCAAFPGGIPIEIRSNEIDHRTPYKGDNGIQFEKIKGE